MTWTTEQDQALKAVDNWYRHQDQQVFRLFGYAGTGKTTLAKHLAGGIGSEVLFGAFTGKASHVLRQKGCTGASTIHSMIYNPREPGRARLKQLEEDLINLRAELRAEYSIDVQDPTEVEEIIDMHERVKDLRQMIAEERDDVARPMFQLREDSPVQDAGLVIIDECSMVDAEMGQDLLSFGTKVLVLGDPAQLPPVAGNGFFTDMGPDFMLTEIHRQATDNPIIAMATQVRQEQALQLGSYGDSLVTDQRMQPEDALAADQILVGKNDTRHGVNRRIRELRGFTEPGPEPEDKLVCLRNNSNLGLMNGSLWKLTDVGDISDDHMHGTVVAEDEPEWEMTVPMHMHYFQQRGDDLPWWDRKEAEEFDYGYALTVHKAQGSQWDNVMLFDQSYCFRQDKWKWLYTGLTRAAEKVTVLV